MKTRTIIVIAAIAVSLAAGLLLKSSSAWKEDRQAGAPLVLFTDGTSHTGASGKLEIRCDGAKMQVRLYVPIRALPPAGGAAGTPTLSVTEEWHDAKDTVSDGGQPEWVAAGAYATRTDAAAFIKRVKNSDWLYLHSLAFEDGGNLTSSLIMFPVRGLESYSAKMAQACGPVP